MTHFNKFRTASVVKWVFSTSPLKHQKSSKSHFSGCRGTSFCIKMPVCYSIRSPITTEPSCKEVGLKPSSRTVRRNLLPAAQAALLDYFHCTRGLHFTDAEQISSNSPIFLRKLLKNVRKERGTRPSVAKFLLYHPINEFEAFFESLGLNPSEISLLLPYNSMFLSNTLLANVHILCNYGILRTKIAKIYKEAAEILGYEHGVLSLKIRAYEELGLSKTSVLKLVVSCPSVLIGDANGEFAKLLWELKSLGIDCDWMLGCLSEKNSYACRRMLGVLHFLKGMGYGKANRAAEFKGKFLTQYVFCMESRGKANCCLYELREMVDTDWPLSNYEQYYPTNEQDCRKVSLSDCFCAVSIFRNENCW